MSLPAQLNQFKSRVADFLFPPHCIGCGTEGSFLCLPCKRKLPRLLPPQCPRCGKPLGLENRCRSCQDWQPEIDGIRSPFLFEGIIRDSIHQFKYSNFTALAYPLAQLLAEYWRTINIEAEIIVPVPLHSRRLRERGYNQAALLAKEFGRLADLPVEEEVLYRLSNTPAQVKASNAEARRNNVLEAFACYNGKLEGKRILLIDDVCTTGATLDACAAVLNRAGATSVWGLTLAREI